MLTPAYRLAPKAAEQLDEILYSLAEHSGWDRSMDLEHRFYTAFQELAQTPGLGHLRPDLVMEEVFFYGVEPYLILYRKHPEVIRIVNIWHGSRDIRLLNRTLLP